MHIFDKISNKYNQKVVADADQKTQIERNKDTYSIKINELYTALAPIHGCTFYDKNMCVYIIGVKLRCNTWGDDYFIEVCYGSNMAKPCGGVIISQERETDKFHVSAFGWFHWNYSPKAGEFYFVFDTPTEVVDWISNGLAQFLLDEPKEYKPSLLQRVVRYWWGVEYSVEVAQSKLLRDFLKSGK